MNKSISFSINLYVDHSLTPLEDISVKFDPALIISLLNLTFESFENCTNVFHVHSITNVKTGSGKNSVRRQVIYRFTSLSRDTFFNARIYRDIFVHQTLRDRMSYYTFTKPLRMT